MNKKPNDFNEIEKAIFTGFEEIKQQFPRISIETLQDYAELCLSYDVSFLASWLEEFTRGLWPSYRMLIVRIIDVILMSRNKSNSHKIDIFRTKLSFRLIEIMTLVALCRDDHKKAIIPIIMNWKNQQFFDVYLLEEIISMFSSTIYSPTKSQQYVPIDKQTQPHFNRLLMSVDDVQKKDDSQDQKQRNSKDDLYKNNYNNTNNNQSLSDKQNQSNQNQIQRKNDQNNQLSMNLQLSPTEKQFSSNRSTQTNQNDKFNQSKQNNQTRPTNQNSPIQDAERYRGRQYNSSRSSSPYNRNDSNYRDMNDRYRDNSPRRYRSRSREGYRNTNRFSRSPSPQRRYSRSPLPYRGRSVSTRRYSPQNSMMNSPRMNRRDTGRNSMRRSPPRRGRYDSRSISRGRSNSRRRERSFSRDQYKRDDLLPTFSDVRSDLPEPTEGGFQRYDIDDDERIRPENSNQKKTNVQIISINQNPNQSIYSKPHNQQIQQNVPNQINQSIQNNPLNKTVDKQLNQNIPQTQTKPISTFDSSLKTVLTTLATNKIVISNCQKVNWKSIDDVKKELGNSEIKNISFDEKNDKCSVIFVHREDALKFKIDSSDKEITIEWDREEWMGQGEMDDNGLIEVLIASIPKTVVVKEDGTYSYE